VNASLLLETCWYLLDKRDVIMACYGSSMITPALEGELKMRKIIGTSGYNERSDHGVLQQQYAHSCMTMTIVSSMQRDGYLSHLSLLVGSCAVFA